MCAPWQLACLDDLFVWQGPHVATSPAPNKMPQVDLHKGTHSGILQALDSPTQSRHDKLGCFACRLKALLDHCLK